MLHDCDLHQRQSADNEEQRLRIEKLKAEVAELRTDNDEEAITFEFSREPKTETKS